MMRHGGQILVDQLKLHGVERVFSVPGESFLAALDGLHNSGIPNIVCRHEGGAAMMAEATGKLTGKPGIAFVTRGPGATNASSGVHVAKQDSTPMILFVGQIARNHVDREAFQEVDYKSMFGSLAKWVAEVRDIDRLPEYINRAFHIAQSGRPGPVVLALPEDMLSGSSSVIAQKPNATPRIAIDLDDVSQLADFIATAERPLVIAGGPGWSAKTASDLQKFAEASNLPVAVQFRRQSYMDNRSPSYAGDLGVGMNPKLAQRLKDADRLLILGARFGDIATNGYEILDPADHGKQIAQVHPDPDMLGIVFRNDISIVANTADMIAALAQSPCTPNQARSEWTASAQADYQSWTKPKETPGDVKMEQVVTWLSDNLPDDAILTNGAGNYAAWLHRYYSFRQYGTQVAPTSGSMGYGFPAAIAAKLEHPDRTVVCMAGDGCFQMTLNEMSTAKQHGVNVIVVVANNGRYGTIRMHQERHYPGRSSGTDLANPDFAMLAKAYGAYGGVVEKTEDFPMEFQKAMDANTPAIIELKLDPEALSTGLTLSETRAIGQAK